MFARTPRLAFSRASSPGGQIEEPGKVDTNRLDVVCIDQASVQECNHQVGMMGPIYESAVEVCAWLGPPSVVADALFKPLCQGRSTTNSGFNFRQVRIGFELIIKHRYFTRLWIVQELVLAKEIRLTVGQDALDWNKFILSWQYAYFGKGRFLEQIIWARRAYREAPYKLSLTQMINKFGDMDCQVSHDHVNALLALAGESERVKVDYNMCLKSLIVQIAVSLDPAPFLEGPHTDTLG